MNNSRGMRRAQQRDESRKKRKDLKRSTPVLKEPKDTAVKAKVQPQMSPRTLSLSYILCMMANFITILSSVVFPVLQNQSFSIQSLLQSNSSLPGLLFQLIALVIVNLMLYRLLLKFERKVQAQTLGIIGVIAAGILAVQTAVVLL